MVVCVGEELGEDWINEDVDVLLAGKVRGLCLFMGGLGRALRVLLLLSVTLWD